MPKSILKNPTQTTEEDHNRQIALQHADLIQQRKDIELEILSATESLIDLPTPGQKDPARPFSSDLSLVEEALNIFQPSDFDTLVEERNINRRCGYVLCPHPNRLQNTNANFRILQNSSRGSDRLKVVPTKDLEKWCSDECGRRALWLRVQLAEEPAWGRRGAKPRRFMLPDGKTELNVDSPEGALSGKMSNLELDTKRDPLIQAMDSLALERGDKPSPPRPTRGVEVSVVENLTSHGQAEEPHDINNYDSIEGHRPRATDDLLRKSSIDGSNDILDTI